MTKIGLGGSCHWCTEAVFLSLKGIDAVRQGWIAADNEPDNFSEAILIEFSPGMIPLETLIDIHLHTHSSTSNHPLRARYRSAVYIFSPEQEAEARQALAVLGHRFDAPLVTEVLPFYRFRENEEHYQNYYYRAPEKPFCQTYIDPKLRILLERYAKHVNGRVLAADSCKGLPSGAEADGAKGQPAPGPGV